MNSTTLAPIGDATQVTFTQTGSGAVTRTVADKLYECVSVDDFGATGSGITDDYSFILAAQNALIARGGGQLLFTYGKRYLVRTPIPQASGVTYQGSGKTTVDNRGTREGAKIFSDTTDVFVNSGSINTGVTFRDLWIESQTNGGHVFNWSANGIVAKVEIDGCVLFQNNKAKSVINGVASGGVFSIYLHNFEFEYMDGNTVPALLFKTFTVNSVVIENFWSLASNSSLAGTYAIWFETTNASGPAMNCLVRQGVFEVAKGGAVNMLGCAMSGIEQSTIYDLSVAPNRPIFNIDAAAVGTASTACWIKGSRSFVGSAAVPDVRVNVSVAGQSGFVLENNTILWYDQVSASANGILIIGSGIFNFVQQNFTRFGCSPTRDIEFRNTGAGSSSFTIWNGYVGNSNGHLVTSLNGGYAGSITPFGTWQWGGSVAAPKCQIDSTGLIATANKIYPGHLTATQQVNCGLYAGAGAPGTQGSVGDFYFRSDGSTGTSIYQKRAAGWVGVV